MMGHEVDDRIFINHLLDLGYRYPTISLIPIQKWNVIYIYAIVYNLFDYLQFITLYITFWIEKQLQKILRHTNFIQFISFPILF